MFAFIPSFHSEILGSHDDEVEATHS